MIFADKVKVILKEKRIVGGTATFVIVFEGYTRGTVTTLSPEVIAATTVKSRLRVFLAPFSQLIKPTATSSDLEMAWGPFTKISPDGMVEPHFLSGRLHHYEMFAIGSVS